MPRPRFKKLEPEKQAHILAVAAKHFAADGFEGASMNRILEEAGVSKGAAYYYFDDKGDLFATAIEVWWDRVAAELWPDGGLALGGSADFWGQTYALYLRQLAFFRAEPDVSRMVKSLPDALHDPSVARLAPRYEALLNGVLALMERGRATGHVRTDLPLDLLMHMLSGLDDGIDRWLIDHPDAIDADPGLPRRTFDALRSVLEARDA
ncbi:MAG: TetR/AcrR family transcriptional regulator [Myxococcota bacterium]